MISPIPTRRESPRRAPDWIGNRTASSGRLFITDDRSLRRRELVQHFAPASVDLSATDGTPIERKSFDLKGQVQDKFKLSVVGTAAVATSLYWNHAQQETWIETFPLAGTNTAPLAQLELTAARGEQLHARAMTATACMS
ncbi:hypothetical protein [Chromatium okenii]|uniref:Uncharacterized protein n=1 Tax=Chromatium okenii TaxID=61644 RepID=A0A2S7XNE8_9GAMM|nr:hypothetical protein [Chromatium okenii]PQJ94911.1 hypothetical protein CXB77_17435 [Chromatium okenii]